MAQSDFGAAVEVGDGSGHLEDAVVGAGGEAQAALRAATTRLRMSALFSKLGSRNATEHYRFTTRLVIVPCLVVTRTK